MSGLCCHLGAGQCSPHSRNGPLEGEFAHEPLRSSKMSGGGKWGRGGNSGPSNRDFANFTGSCPHLLTQFPPGPCRVFKDFWESGGRRGFRPVTCSAARLATAGLCSRGDPQAFKGSKRAAVNFSHPIRSPDKARSATQCPEGARPLRLERRRRRPSGRTKRVWNPGKLYWSGGSHPFPPPGLSTQAPPPAPPLPLL